MTSTNKSGVENYFNFCVHEGELWEGLRKPPTATEKCSGVEKTKKGGEIKKPPGRILFKISMSWLKTVCVQISKKLRKNVWNATG